MHTYLLFLPFGIYVDWCFFASLSLSLSLFWIVCAWYPSAKLLSPRTLFVPGHFLPTLLPYMSGSMIRRLVWTSRRTSQNMAFIQNATLSYRTSSIPFYHCHSQLGLGISLWDPGELFHYDHKGVLLQYAQFWLFYTSFHHLYSRYSYSSHSEAYLQCATCSEGIHPDYLGCPCLKTVSKDELLSLFC